MRRLLKNCRECFWGHVTYSCCIPKSLHVNCLSMFWRCSCELICHMFSRRENLFRRHDGSNEGCCRAARPWHAFATGCCNKACLPNTVCVQANFIKWRAQWKDVELSSRLCLQCWGSSVGNRDKHIRIVMLNLNWTVQTVYPNDCWLTDKSTLKYIESFGQSLRIQIYPESPWSRNVGDAVGVGTRAVIAHTKYIQVL